MTLAVGTSKFGLKAWKSPLISWLTGPAELSRSQSKKNMRGWQLMADIPIASIIRTKNPSILSAFYLPEGAARDDFLTYFCLEYGEFTPVYTEPAILADHIKAVGKVLQYTLDKLYNTLSLEYDPIENYDRHEEWSDDGTDRRDYTGGQHRQTSGNGRTDYVGKETHSTNHTVTETPSGSETETTGPSSVEHKIAADNTGDYFPATKDLYNQDSNATVTRTFNQRVTTTGDNGTTDELTYTDRADIASSGGTEDISYVGRADIGADHGHHIGRVHGNIGVTTSQQMIESERDLARYSFYREAALLYASHLLIMVY